VVNTELLDYNIHIHMTLWQIAVLFGYTKGVMEFLAAGVNHT
jgi:hypothetical protein